MGAERIRGIVTDVVKHSDRHNIVTLYTRERGRVAFLSPAGGGKEGRLRNARLMPLAAVECQVAFRANRELQTLGRFSTLHPWKELYFHPVKSSVVMFLSEFLNAFLRYSEADERQWDYIYNSLLVFDGARKGVANFHLAFLMEFLHFAGIFPDLTERHPEAVFDMRGGVTTVLPPGHSDILPPEMVALLRRVSRMTVENFGVFRFTGDQRRQVLELLLRYYTIHFPGMGGLKSVAILSELFSGA